MCVIILSAIWYKYIYGTNLSPEDNFHGYKDCLKRN